jgi:serine O-acetyltransferase
MFENVAADIRRYIPLQARGKPLNPWLVVRTALPRPELRLILLYRYARWVHTRMPFRILRLLMHVPYSLLSPMQETLYGIHIPWSADIGKGLYIGHFGDIWIGPIKMGESCNIAHGVTIGMGGRGEDRGIPTIGDRVWIGTGAKIFGQITIGDNVAISANTVVSKSIPDGAVVAGNPGRIISYEGSREYVR